MFAIGQLSKLTGVKVPTIRYYEQVGLLESSGRTDGNQRRYDQKGVERLGFIKHARDLGFSIDAITALIDLQLHPDRSCQEATDIAVDQLADVREKMRRLAALETELVRISDGCDGGGSSNDCYVLASLSNHRNCVNEHT